MSRTYRVAIAGATGAEHALAEAEKNLSQAAEIIQATYFYGDNHQRIYAAIHHLYENGVRGIDPLTLAEELSRRGELEEVGGPLYLVEILDAVPNAAHAKYYASIIREKWIQRSLIYACTDILRESYAATSDTADILDLEAQSRLALARAMKPFFLGATGIALDDSGQVPYEEQFVLRNLRRG